MSEIFVVSNDRFFLKKKKIFNSNKNTFTIINCFKKFNQVNLIARTSKNKLNFQDQLGNIKLTSLFSLFKKKDNIRLNKILIISLTPYNFFVSCVLILLGAREKNTFLFLRSDGYEEYRIKFGIIGYFFYGLMLGFLKKKFNILSCSKNLTGINKSILVFPSEISDNWLKNRKKQIKILNKKRQINLLYLGRFRKEKGFLSLINLFEKLKIDSTLTMVGNDLKYFEKSQYPNNKRIKIFGQVSSTKKLINFFDKSDIFILPSYVEAYPQVILESLSRLKPILVFNDIKYLKKTFTFGLFNCERNSYHFEKNLKKIITNYRKIQTNILKRKIYSSKYFEITMHKIFKDK